MLLGSFPNHNSSASKDVFYFYADSNISETPLTNKDDLEKLHDSQQWKQSESPIVMVSESVVDSQDELQVIDLLVHSNQSSLSHSVNSPVVTNQPKYNSWWFKHAENTVTQFQQNELDYFAISNNVQDAFKMVVYKIDKSG